MTDQTAGTAETQTTQATETTATTAAADTTQTTQAATADAIADMARARAAETTAGATTTTTDQPKAWIADDWRERLAGDDPKALARLQRFPDVGAVFKSFRELETKLSSGALKTPLPENPTPEQVKEYREANGIPATPAEYKIELSDGLVVGEADQPLISGFLEAAHEVNAPPHIVNALVDEYYHFREAQIEEAATRAETDKATLIETLKGELGGNFRAEMASVYNFFQAMPDGIGDMLLTAKLADGSTVGNNIAVTKAIMAIARELNPAGTVVPGQGGDQLSAVNDQIAKFESEMKSNIQKWQHGSNAANQQKYRDLLEAREKMKPRGQGR